MKKNRSLILVLFILYCYSCHKKYDAVEDQPANVFVLGEENGATGLNYIYWKNSDPVNLPDDSYHVYSIAVSGNDVYVAGQNWYYRATYWKNGIAVPLSKDSMIGRAFSIVVSGNDVYVAGDDVVMDSIAPYGGAPFIAKYWKNGMPVSLTDGSTTARATSIVISQNNVYVAGWESDENGTNYIAKYWKNGIPVNLTDGSRDTYANSIAVSGNDVYVAGIEQSVTYPSYELGKYWKNGSPVSLTDGSIRSFANSIAVSGNDVYVAGGKFNGTKIIATYWKNGSPVPLTDGSKASMANSIALAGNDVYVAGWEFNGTRSIAKYWKNGNPVNLSDGSNDAYANSIFLTPK
ncbi:MAG TPA: hypothetical protein VFH07_01435 [Chitinophagaceae bacterium]|jgi:hypothetical protein|nr:hypothetical protein [Chitinophagaceae bacterium]